MTVIITHGKKPLQYKTGYGKPPQKSQFKKGQSGNPKGRPKGHKNFKTDLEETLAQTITVRIDGHERKMTKQRAFIEGMVGRSLQGNDRSGTHLLSTIMRILGDSVEAGELPDVTSDDLDILRRFEQRLTEKIKHTGEGK